jgi:hypothetical protein
MKITEVKSGQWFKHNNIEFMKIDGTKNTKIEPYEIAVTFDGVIVLINPGIEVEPLDKVIVDRRDYLYLQNRDNELNCLEAGGVDNWEWYDESLENFEEIK